MPFKVPFLSVIMMFSMTMPTEAVNKHYPSSRDPLLPSAFTPMPLGAVRPEGWLKDQLTIQANGLTGHLDEFWKDLGPDSAWRGGNGEGWERGPYYLDGLVPLAYLLDDQRLKDKAKPFIEYMVNSSQENGWFGPAKNKDRWPLAISLKVLTQYHEATGDERALKVIQRYFDYLKAAQPDWPDKDWRGVRAGENVLTAIWLYNRTGNGDYLKVAESIFANSFNWPGYFETFPYKAKVPRNMGHNSHVVNIAMGTKYPGLRYALTGDQAFAKAAYTGIANLDKYHGQVAGRFSGDEHLAGTHPSQGTELCAVVEYMFSLEHLYAIFGDAALADRIEMLAYNALPGTCTPDFWAHQYDQQGNQVLVSIAKRQWTTNGNDSNVYGLEPHFGCCTANMHQGWPKLVAHMWMATPDNGLAAAILGPSRVKAKVADGTVVTVTETTTYPFDGSIRFTVEAPDAVEFPLYLRVPKWTRGKATVRVNGQRTDMKPTGDHLVVTRLWKSGDTLDVDLPMELRAEKRYNDAIAIHRGPLVFSLKIGERFEKLKSNHATLPSADWAIHPTTPWNYGLILDGEDLEKSIQVKVAGPGQTPFANDQAPVALTVKGKLLPQWGMVNNSADAPPASPAPTAEPAVDLKLVPYGCTRLRITEFPTVRP